VPLPQRSSPVNVSEIVSRNGSAFNSVATRRSMSSESCSYARLDLEQPDERRVVRLVEDHDVQHAEAAAAAEEQLLADLHPVGIGRLSHVAAVRKV
jgi:hypothetical protein